MLLDIAMISASLNASEIVYTVSYSSMKMQKTFGCVIKVRFYTGKPIQLANSPCIMEDMTLELKSMPTHASKLNLIHENDIRKEDRRERQNSGRFYNVKVSRFEPEGCTAMNYRRISFREHFLLSKELLPVITKPFRSSIELAHDVQKDKDTAHNTKSTCITDEIVLLPFIRPCHP